METLLEIIMEIVMEGTLYTAGNKKVSLQTHIPLVSVLLLFFGFIIAGSFLIGMIIVKKEGSLEGLIMLDISVPMLGVLIKLIVDYRKNWKQSSKQPSRGKKCFEI